MAKDPDNDPSYRTVYWLDIFKLWLMDQITLCNTGGLENYITL